MAPLPRKSSFIYCSKPLGGNPMKKILLIAAGILISTAPVHNAFAAALTQAGGAGTAVTVVGTGVAGAQSIVFNPSTNVSMSGNSVATNFAIAGYHTQALRKASGQAYGMGSDSNKMYFQDISNSTAYTGVAAGTSQATSFTTALNWNQM